MGFFIDFMSKIFGHHKTIDNNNNNIVLYNP